MAQFLKYFKFSINFSMKFTEKCTYFSSNTSRMKSPRVTVQEYLTSTVGRLGIKHLTPWKKFRAFPWGEVFYTSPSNCWGKVHKYLFSILYMEKFAKLCCNYKCKLLSTCLKLNWVTSWKLPSLNLFSRKNDEMVVCYFLLWEHYRVTISNFREIALTLAD